MHAYLEGILVVGNAPVAVAQAFGVAAFFVMTVIMMTSAGSTLDSTFTSLARDIPLLAGREPQERSVRFGIWVMIVFAVLGNLPMVAGTDILKATTVSGTIIMGLAPVFLLQYWVRYSPWSFHLR